MDIETLTVFCQYCKGILTVEEDISRQACDICTKGFESTNQEELQAFYKPKNLYSPYDIILWPTPTRFTQTREFLDNLPEVTPNHEEWIPFFTRLTGYTPNKFQNILFNHFWDMSRANHSNLLPPHYYIRNVGKTTFFLVFGLFKLLHYGNPDPIRILVPTLTEERRLSQLLQQYLTYLRFEEIERLGFSLRLNYPQNSSFRNEHDLIDIESLSGRFGLGNPHFRLVGERGDYGEERGVRRPLQVFHDLSRSIMDYGYRFRR